jgi:hypothetical protein
VLRAIAIAVLLLGLMPEVARGAPWRPPVRGRIVTPFAYDPASPYRAGMHRGISLSAAPGAPVRSACAGEVLFAGTVAGRLTISVRCGAFRATYQGVAALAVGAGDRVRAGAPLATAAADGVVHLGARRARGDYVDPATLFGSTPPALGPAPSPRAIRRPPGRVIRRPQPPRAAPLPTPAAAPVAVPGAAPAAPPHAAPAASSDARPVTPPLAWLGAALLALAVPGGLLRARRGRTRGPALSRPSSATPWSR